MRTVPGNVLDGAGSADRPEYARKIRDFRTLARVTQPKLASDVGIKRGAVAEWERGGRAPSARHYEALAAYAEREKLMPFADFFREQIRGKPGARRERREQKLQRTYAIRYLKMIQADAAKGDKHAVRLLTLARLDRCAHASLILESLREEVARLETRALSFLLDKARAEAHEVENLRSAYESSQRGWVGRKSRAPK